MIGLGVLVAIVAMALLAPVISNHDELRAVNTIDNPTWATPSEFPPLGTDNLGRSVWAQFVWGARISLLVGLAATLIGVPPVGGRGTWGGCGHRPSLRKNGAMQVV